MGNSSSKKKEADSNPLVSHLLDEPPADSKAQVIGIPRGNQDFSAQVLNPPVRVAESKICGKRLRPPRNQADREMIEFLIKAEALLNYADAEIQRAATENLLILIDSYNFRAGPVYYIQIKDPVNFIGYKLVCLQIRNIIVQNAVALFELAAFRIASSEDGRFLNVNELKRNEKYCTDIAIPQRLRIICKPHYLEQIEKSLKKDECKFISIFDSRVQYILGQPIFVPDFSKPGIGCVQGIHLFINPDAALHYMKTGFGGMDCKNPLIISHPIDPSFVTDRLMAEFAEGSAKSKVITQNKLYEKVWNDAHGEIQPPDDSELSREIEEEAEDFDL